MYDRGLSGNEINQLFLGDVNNSGVIEYRAIKKPEVRTLSALDARPQSVVLRAELLPLEVMSLKAPVQSTEVFKKVQSGTASLVHCREYRSGERWQCDYLKDKSDYGRNFENVEGNPRLFAFGLNGKPVVSFDGDDLLWTGHNFDTLTSTGYTMVSLARYTGLKTNGSSVQEPEISSSVFTVRKWESGMLRDGFRPPVRLTVIGIYISARSKQSRRPCGKPLGGRCSKSLRIPWVKQCKLCPGVLQLGGWKTDDELSACEIAEIFIYQGQLNAIERSQLEGYIAHKWNLTEQILPADTPMLPSLLLEVQPVHHRFRVSGVIQLKFIYFGETKELNKTRPW